MLNVLTAAATRPLRPWRSGPKTVWVGFALLIVAAPLVFRSDLAHNILSQIGIGVIACLAYNILLGQGGMLSFGHAVYSGLGAFLAIHTLARVSAGNLELPISLIPLVAGVSGAFFAMLLGFVTTKKAGTPFAMITLGIGELVWSMALMFPSFFGGEGGVSANRVAGAPFLGVTWGPQIQVYYLIACYTFVSTALMYAFTLTPLGRILNAVRDNPERAEFVGYDTRKVRHLAFIVSAFFAGISGGLAVLNFEIVTSEAMSTWRSGQYLVFTFLGGIAFFYGPIIGAVLMVLSSVLLSEMTMAWQLYMGLAFMLMVIFAPGGVAGIIEVNRRVVAAGRLRQVIGSYVALAASALWAFMGVAAMVEMLYHLQLGAAMSPVLRFAGLTLDPSRSITWLGALLASAVGCALFALARRRFLQKWAHIQQQLASPSFQQEATQ
jgi:branched-chain amino acid transport system permease protein